VTQQIESELVRYFDAKIDQAAAMHPNYQQLWQVMKRVTLAGGKRIRPKLFLFAVSAYSNNDNVEEYVEPAIAWEILHSSLLIHDDIMDHATTRHGVDNVTGEYLKIYAENSNRNDGGLLDFANSSALLAGDLLLNASRDIIQNSKLSSDQKWKFQTLLNRGMEEAACGQLLDSQSPTLPIDAIDPDIIIRGKTSGYTTIGPLVSGAAVAGASDEELALLTEVGVSLGKIFQLTDDVLGSFGDEAVTGKSNSSDIRDGERTALLQETYKRASADDKSRLEKLDGTNLPDDEEIEYIRNLMISTGAKKSVEDQISDLFNSAIDDINLLSISEANKQYLRELAEKLKTRQL
jgi:geranylgeranyl pyrophosphate synthase